MQRILSIILSCLVLISMVSCSTFNPSSSSSKNDTASVFSEIASENTDSLTGESSSRPSRPQNNSQNQLPTTSSTESSVVSSGGSSNTTSSNTVTSSGGTSSDTTSSGQGQTPPTLSGPIAAEDYFCYANLNSNQKTIYNALLSSGMNMDSVWIEIELQGRVGFRDVALAFFSLETDHPELFWLPSQYYVKTLANKIQFLFTNDGSASNPQSSTYLIKKSQQAEMSAKLREEVNEIKAQVTSSDPYEIALQLHDILCDRITYSTSDEPDPMIWTAYGALVNNSAVCEGYARAYQLLLYEFGIVSTLSTGLAGGEGHMWNIVNLNGQNYHVDVTWDDRDDGGSPNFHAFFNLTDSQIRLTHNPHPDFSLIKDSVFDSGEAVSYNFNLPECNDDSLNYFNVTGAVFNAGNEDAIADHIIKTNGNVEFKYVGATPDMTKINNSLSKKRSNLRVTSWIKKASADVLILEVEQVM